MWARLRNLGRKTNGAVLKLSNYITNDFCNTVELS